MVSKIRGLSRMFPMTITQVMSAPHRCFRVLFRAFAPNSGVAEVHLDDGFSNSGCSAMC